MMEICCGSVGNNCNLLINAAAGPDGLIAEAQLRRFREFGQQIQRHFRTSLAETSGKGQTIELKPNQSNTIDQVTRMEKITELAGFLDGSGLQAQPPFLNQPTTRETPPNSRAADGVRARLPCRFGFRTSGF